MARYARTDRFGNEYQLVGCKPSRRNPDFSVGYLRIGGTLYKLEPSRSNKEGVSEWIRVTKLKSRQSSSRW